ncbi:MAG: hypothetical protein JWO36_244 [Myxococcales bacterium]|nr:hypothetical protein [Myxococcales bacterium]
MRVVPIAAFALTGCAQLFGIAETSAPDAPAGTVSLQVQRESIGATIVKGPQDLTGQTATFLVPDAADPSGYRRVPATLSASLDTWTAIIPDGTPLIEFTLPDYPEPMTRLLALPNRNILYSFYVYEHPAPVAPPSPASFDVNVTLPTPYAVNESFQAYSIGTWSYHNFTAAEVPAAAGPTVLGPINIPYDAAHFANITGRAIEKVTTDDQFLVLRYVGPDLTGFLELPRFDQTGVDGVTGAMAANPHTAMLDLMVEPTKPAMRFAGVRPATTATSMSWILAASPGYASAHLSGPGLQSAGVLPADTGKITAAYGNPFVAHGWNTALLWNPNATRSYTDPATMLAVTLYTGLQQMVEPTSGQLLDLPSGLPISVSANQTALISDGNTLTLDPTKSVELSATFDRATCTFYQMDVIELLPNTAAPMPTALTGHVRYFTMQTAQTIKIPPGVFVTDHLYTVRVHCVQGAYPTFADGNLQNRTLPFSQGYLDSGVFKVSL